MWNLELDLVPVAVTALSSLAVWVGSRIRRRRRRSRLDEQASPQQSPPRNRSVEITITWQDKPGA